MTIVAAFAVVASFTILLLLYPLLRRQPAPPPRAAFDRALLRDRLREIDREFEQGVIGRTEAEASRIEVQRRLLATEAKNEAQPPQHSAGRPIITAIALSILIPLGGVTLYLKLGTPDAADRSLASTAPQRGDERATMDQLVERLAERMRAQPDDPQGWRLLARSYTSMSRYDEAAEAYTKALAASNSQAGIASDFGEMLYAAAGSRMTPAAQGLFETALGADPFDPKARFYLAVAFAERGAFKDAIQAWTDLIALSPADAPWIGSVRDQIARVAEIARIDPVSVEPSAEARRLANSLPRYSPPPAAGTAGAPIDPASAEAIAALPEAERSAMVRAMVEQLARRLNENPNDREGWLKLARAYDVLGEPDKAQEARERAEKAQ
jgi:cytochrome c-type biogenesis protein CcmH